MACRWIMLPPRGISKVILEVAALRPRPGSIYRCAPQRHELTAPIFIYNRVFLRFKSIIRADTRGRKEKKRGFWRGSKKGRKRRGAEVELQQRQQVEKKKRNGGGGGGRRRRRRRRRKGRVCGVPEPSLT